jgi:hypothetical protein
MPVDTSSAVEIGERFLDALGRHDYAGLVGCFAAGAQLRAVVPSGVREDEGGEAIAARFERWTAEADLVDSGVDVFVDLLRLRYVFHEIDPDGGLSSFEQTVYADIDDGLIASMRIACSGPRPVAG